MALAKKEDVELQKAYIKVVLIDLGFYSDEEEIRFVRIKDGLTTVVEFFNGSVAVAYYIGNEKFVWVKVPVVGGVTRTPAGLRFSSATNMALVE